LQFREATKKRCHPERSRIRAAKSKDLGTYFAAYVDEMRRFFDSLSLAQNDIHFSAVRISINFHLKNTGGGKAVPGLCILFQFKYTGIKLIIGALLGNEVIMGAPLDDPALVQHHDAVGIHDGGKAVGNDEDRAALH